MLKLIIFVLNYLTVLFYTKAIIHLRACLHGGGGPQVSEVTRLHDTWGDPPHIRKLKQRRRRRQQERQKSNWFRLANNNFVRVSRFFVHFFAVTALLRRENAYFHVL